ncbi:MAG TPA: penicillin-binding protein, partial [Rhodobacteraceae bacterium]|nr:penicillin-binding protein [Paracoccaceae bacterium]
MTEEQLTALKIAFTYMPKAIEVNKYEYGDEFQRVLDQIETVREI